MSDLAQWLETHGLGKYAGVLLDNDIDFDVITLVREDHLRELGISLGDRLRLLQAIAMLDDPDALPREAVDANHDTTSARPPAGEAERRQLT